MKVLVAGQFCVSNACKSTGCKKDSECKAGQICENGVCKDKTADSQECKWYETNYEKESLVYSWYNYIGIGNPKTVTTTGCKTSGIVYFIVFGIITMAVIIFLIVWFYPKKIRRRKK
jgi:hypothetical protein